MFEQNIHPHPCDSCLRKNPDVYPTGQYFEGDIILTPDQLSAILEQKSKNSFASVRTGLWLDNGKVQKIIEYGIDPKLGKILLNLDLK